MDKDEIGRKVIASRYPNLIGILINPFNVYT